MGSQASKPTRKLTNTISKSTGSAVNRATNINQLPSQNLKDQYEKHNIEKEYEAYKQSVETPSNILDRSINQTSNGHLHNPNSSLNTSLLKKKIKNTPSSLNTEIPEGKDGSDPQVQGDFIDSITKLGRQIKTHSAESNQNVNSLALKQLQNRKELYEKGQKELEAQMETGSHSLNVSDHAFRTMVHPRTLGAIINDIHDPRVTQDTIIKDYQLQQNFLKELGTRFKVASTTVVFEEKPKEDEIAPKVGQPEKSMLDYDGELNEKVDQERLKKLKERISLDD